MVKVKLHIPTEQYGFVEVEEDAESIVQAIEMYNYASQLTKPKAGLAEKDFNACLDRYLTEKTMDSNAYVAMSPEQQSLVQAIKRSFNRIKNK